jgi:integrase
VKYHALLHKIFARAVVDRVIPVNPASHTALPKVVTKPKQIITAAQFEAILANVPARYRTMVLLAIETGLRWGELIALRPCDINLKTHIVLVRRTIGEVAKKHSPTGERCYVKDYPKDDEQRQLQIDPATGALLREHIQSYEVEDIGLLFTSKAGTPLSRNNFRTKFWAPAVKAAAVEQKVTFHNLRAAHASWLLAVAERTSSSSKNVSVTAASRRRSSTPARCPTLATVHWPRSARSATASPRQGPRERETTVSSLPTWV